MIKCYDFVRCRHGEKLGDGYTLFTALKSFKTQLHESTVRLLWASPERGPRIRLCRDLKVESTLTAPALATVLPNMPPWFPGLWLLDLWFHDNKEKHDGSVGLVVGVLFFIREAPMPPKDKWGALALNFTKASLVVHCKESGSNAGGSRFDS